MNFAVGTLWPAHFLAQSRHQFSITLPRMEPRLAEMTNEETIGIAKDKATAPKRLDRSMTSLSILDSSETAIEAPEFDERLDEVAIEVEDEVEEDISLGTLAPVTDPISLYLREMATVPMLTREQEVAIARRIERGRRDVLKALSRSPRVIEELIEIGRSLRAGEIDIRDVINPAEFTDLNEERIEEPLTYTLECLATIKKNYTRVLTM